MKAIGYARVSTEEQAREGISLDNQEDRIKAYCTLNGLELAEIIRDEGKSGKDLNRDGIKALIGKATHKEVDAVVVYKLDRLSRRVLDTLSLIEIFRKKGIAFHSLTEKIDTQSAMGQFFLNMMASLAQMERDLISERTRDALGHKRANSERIGEIPLGWDLAEDGKTLVRNEREQKTIQEINRLRARGFSYQRIADYLNERAISTKKGCLWKAMTVKQTLDRLQKAA